MINQALKAKWVEALRSGRYKQTTRVLYRTGPRDGTAPCTFCALGVLVDVMNRPSDLDQKWADIKNGDAIDADVSTGILAEASGLNHFVIGTIVMMNDHSSATFAEIAEYVDGLAAT